MNRVKKYFLCVLAVFSLLATVLPAGAAEITQDGLGVTFTSDKESYSETEVITVTLSVTNTNDYDVSNVTLKGILPKGLGWDEDQVGQESIEILPAGETVTLELQVVPEIIEATTTTKGNSSTTGSVKTGDSSVPVVWMVLAVIALLAILTIIVKKKYTKALSVLLCFGMLAMMFSSIQANAADEKELGSIDVEIGIKVANTDYTVQGKVTYELPEQVIAQGLISGVVKSIDGELLPDAVVTVNETPVSLNNAAAFSYALDAGSYKVVVSCEEYFSETISDVVVISGENNNLGDIKLTPLPEPGNCVLEGLIKNAETNRPVEGAKVKLRAGTDEFSSEYVKTRYGYDYEITSDADGQYKMEELHEGDYTIEVSKNGYITGYENVTIDEGDNEKDIIITPSLEEEEYRAVLTWGAEPEDLDSHLEGPLSDGRTFHVYYANKKAEDDGVRVAELDVDEKYGYGPETLTMRFITDGVYYFYIYDYNKTGGLPISGAQVKLYKGSELIGTYDVPTDQGNEVYWNVFTYSNGVITPVNTITAQPYKG